MADTSAMSDIRESSSVDKYNGSNFQLLSFIFQSRELYIILWSGGHIIFMSLIGYDLSPCRVGGQLALSHTHPLSSCLLSNVHKWLP